jgi:hypothetical protein
MIDLVHPTVHELALDRKLVIRPSGFHVHQMEESWTVDVFTDHPHGQKGLFQLFGSGDHWVLIDHGSILVKTASTTDFSKVTYPDHQSHL